MAVEHPVSSRPRIEALYKPECCTQKGKFAFNRFDTAGAKERHKRAQRAQFDPLAPVPEGLVAKPSVPKFKHHTYFEFVENKEKKKKLEVQVQMKMSYPSSGLGKKTH
ncbi:hypothetical protein E4U53_007268 [Claviceps sorghi]|nr:hypothetical protein E4U53_007268 [Claviceps sorghi]